MDESDASPSPDAFEVEFDGIEFRVVYDENQAGTYHYTRCTPPAVGYGFTSRRSDHQRSTVVDHLEAIRNFLAVCDPSTGLIEEDFGNELDDD